MGKKKSLIEDQPAFLDEWNWELNNEYTPENLSKWSKKNVWCLFKRDPLIKGRSNIKTVIQGKVFVVAGDKFRHKKLLLNRKV